MEYIIEFVKAIKQEGIWILYNIMAYYSIYVTKDVCTHKNMHKSSRQRLKVTGFKLILSAGEDPAIAAYLKDHLTV